MAPTRARSHKQKEPHEPSYDLDDRTAARVHTLIAEGALRRACTALTADPLVSPTPAVIDELRLLHPNPTAAHRDAIDKLRPVFPGAVPGIEPDLGRKALTTCASTSCSAVCLAPRSWPFASPTLSVRWQQVKRFVGIVERFALIRSILETVQVGV